MAEPCVLSNFNPRLDLSRTSEPIAETNPSQLMALPECSRPSPSQQIDPREKWRLKGAHAFGTAKVTTLASADLNVENSFDKPENVGPKASTMAPGVGEIKLELQPYSLTVYRIPIE